MPINAVKVVLLGDEKRGDCYGHGEGQGDYSSAADSYDYKNDYPGLCDKTDTRWDALDALAETAYLSNHFTLQANCTVNPTLRDTADFLATGAACGSSPFTDPDCMVNGYTNFGASACAATDDICRNIVFQSKCGALTRWASQAGKSWSVIFRREIFWKSDCAVSKLEIEGSIDDLDTVESSLLTNVIINAIANFFLGVFFPLAIMFNRFKGDCYCIPGAPPKWSNAAFVLSSDESWVRAPHTSN
jgi:hypothetical protein